MNYMRFSREVSPEGYDPSMRRSQRRCLSSQHTGRYVLPSWAVVRMQSLGVYPLAVVARDASNPSTGLSAEQQFGTPGWSRTTDVSSSRIYSPLSSPLDIPTHNTRSKVPQTLSMNRRNSGQISSILYIVDGICISAGASNYRLPSSQASNHDQPTTRVPSPCFMRQSLVRWYRASRRIRIAISALRRRRTAIVRWRQIGRSQSFLMLPGVQFISRLKMTLIGGVQESFFFLRISPLGT